MPSWERSKAWPPRCPGSKREGHGCQWRATESAQAACSTPGSDLEATTVGTRCGQRQRWPG
eukprot:9982149-Alexandrium_andersonii.AAC.1